MFWTICRGLLIPLLGTSLGAACVLFMKKEMHRMLRRSLTGFAAGVMVAASVWSLLLPAIDQSSGLGALAFFPAASGFCAGMLFLMVLDKISPRMEMQDSTGMLVLAVVLHNIPEGMAVGVAYAGLLSGQKGAPASAAFMLSLGIAIQNFPEGAIISMPLASQGMSKGRAFRQGVLSGVVEPVAGALTVLLSALVVPALPYLLAFAAGAMMYVVIEELVPELQSLWGNCMFMLGFALMMALDVALG